MVYRSYPLPYGFVRTFNNKEGKLIMGKVYLTPGRSVTAIPKCRPDPRGEEYIEGIFSCFGTFKGTTVAIVEVELNGRIVPVHCDLSNVYIKLETEKGR